jgi:hypothetical protein
MVLMNLKYLREAFDDILRNRGYDNHAADEEIFDELLDELVEVVKLQS